MIISLFYLNFISFIFLSNPLDWEYLVNTLRSDSPPPRPSPPVYFLVRMFLIQLLLQMRLAAR